MKRAHRSSSPNHSLFTNIVQEAMHVLSIVAISYCQSQWQDVCLLGFHNKVEWALGWGSDRLGFEICLSPSLALWHEALWNGDNNINLMNQFIRFWYHFKEFGLNQGRFSVDDDFLPCPIWLLVQSSYFRSSVTANNLLYNHYFIYGFLDAATFVKQDPTTYS